MDQNYNNGSPDRQTPPGRQKKKKKGHPILRFIGKFIGWTILTVFTICVIGVLTAGIFAKIFMTYVETTLIPSLGEVTAEEMSLSLASTIYDGNGNAILTLYDNSEDTGGNRELVTYSQIPRHVIDALVSIEDHRFWEHNGVDWLGTAASIRDTLLNGNTRGGSTITQQLLRIEYDDTDVTVRRKFREICRALEYEKSVSKEDIITDYLNTVYFGAGCYGIQTAAKTYFGKDVSDLDVAEAAAIVGITNNPSLYDPFRNVKFESGKTPRDFNKWRQELILEQMYNYGYITEAEWDTYKKEKLLFTDTDEYKALHGIEVPEETEENEETVDLSKIYTWFEDAAINEARDLLMEQYGYSRDYASKLLYRGGYHIYTTLDPDVQSVIDEVYQNRDNFNYPSKNGTPIDSAITVVDPYTGEIKGLAGGVGIKTVNRGQSLAYTPRQPGSSIKPVSVYAPGIEYDEITPISIIDDYPINNTVSATGYPRNSGGGYSGHMTVTYGVQRSYNTIAARTLLKVGFARSFEFMENNLGFDLDSNDLSVGPLAMGGLTYGVTTTQMAAAYAAFVNRGTYTKPHTILRIESNDHTVTIVDNTEAQSWPAMRETTAYLINKLLQNAAVNGTGYEANFSGMAVAGKTGTTTDNCDRYFAGYTPYYATAVWMGYKDQREWIPAQGNPAARTWKQVMQKLHEELEYKEFFERPEGIITATVCADCGLKPCELCPKTVTGEIQASAAPSAQCTCHVEVRMCYDPESDTSYLAGDYCPEYTVTTEVKFVGREFLDGIYAGDSSYHLTYLQERGRCPIHDENFVPDPVLPGDEGPVLPEEEGIDPTSPTYPDYPNYDPSGVPGWINPQPWTEPTGQDPDPNPQLPDADPMESDPDPAPELEPPVIGPEQPVIGTDPELPEDPDEPQLPDGI